VKIAVLITTFSFFFQALNHVFIGFYQVKLKMHIQVFRRSDEPGRFGAWHCLVALKGAGFLPMMWIVTLASAVYTFVLWIKSDGVQFEIDREITLAIYKKMWPMALGGHF